MKNRFTKTELTGLILLAVLIVAVTGCALLVKSCDATGGSSTAPPFEIQVVDTVETPAPTHSARKTGEKKKSKKRKKASAAKKSSRGSQAQRTDPFADTIPLDL